MKPNADVAICTNIACMTRYMCHRANVDPCGDNQVYTNYSQIDDKACDGFIENGDWIDKMVKGNDGV